MTAVGEDLSTTTSATLVDAAGDDIPGVNAIPFGSLIRTATTVTIPIDAFDDDGNETDALTAIRRVKLYRPEGDLVSITSFTVSSPPVVDGVAAVVYANAGPADGGAATSVYSRGLGTGSISINATGFDMKGVATIEFWDIAGGAKVGGTAILIVPGVDWTVDEAGDTITILAGTLDANQAWFNPDSVTAIRAFRLTTAAGAAAGGQVISTAIRARP